MLLTLGCSVFCAKSKRTILHWAAERSDDIGTLQYLLDHRMDINAVDEVRWFHCTCSVSLSHFEMYLPHQDGWTALSYAVSEGHLKSMKLLIQRGADIHAVTKVS
jgi:ankyrin repeat protein